jgi:hypothetical protein
MILHVFYEGGKLLVRNIPLRPEELLIALPGPSTLRQTRVMGTEHLLAQTTLFPAHKAIREYPGLGKLVPARRVETWVFCLPNIFPAIWEAQVGLSPTPKEPKFKIEKSKLGDYLNLKVRAEDHEIELPIPVECKLAPFQEGASGIEPNLFDRLFSEKWAPLLERSGRLGIP